MFNKLLIANRGEIACRVIKTARHMGIKTVALYSDADINAMHVDMADEAIYIGPSPAKESYLNIERIISSSVSLGVDAIHPGYGFLSENSEFARACEKHNICFIGPPATAIDAMGSKSQAKQIMESAEVPLVPGYHGNEQSIEFLKQASTKIGYPVLLKAAAGGGGKGMRQVDSEASFEAELAAAKREAKNSFNDDHMLVEKYLTQPRHVEIQVFCDSHGNGIYLSERDCSLQRRHQKVIEEAPAPDLPPTVRKLMGEAAVKAAAAIGYIGAGTVEFLYNGGEEFYFMEMNTRLQVEHPVTELITGQDLVEWQLKVAAGESLPLNQDQLTLNGHAFEARIYAEDPDNEFLPVTGQLHLLRMPKESRHVRIDTGVREGDEVSVFYDPMIAKLIVWDENRELALNRLIDALMEFRIGGMKTNIDFLVDLASVPPFRQKQIDTHFIEKNKHLIFQTKPADTFHHLSLAALSVVLKNAHAPFMQRYDVTSPWHSMDNWRANETFQHQLSLRIDSVDHYILVSKRSIPNEYQISIAGETKNYSATLHGEALKVSADGFTAKYTSASFLQNGVLNFCLYGNGESIVFAVNNPDLGEDEDPHDLGLVAPMNGTLVTLLVEDNAIVEKDQPLLVMEAMKMEHVIKAPGNGKVEEFFYQVGDLIDGGAELLSFLPSEQ